MNLLSFLFLLASTMVSVTSQCDFCTNGIPLPDYVVDEATGTTCNDILNVDDPTCLENAVYELVCCPDSSGVDNCDFCPDGVEFPNAVIFNDDRADAETINCAQGVIIAPFVNDTTCSTLIEVGTPPCCPASASTGTLSPASAISSMIAFVATASIGYLVAF